MISTKAFVAILIIGILLMLVGTLGFGFSDPFSDPTPYIVIAVLGGVLFIGGILYMVVLSASSKAR
ncbi:MAG: hypothetical protein ACREAS_07380 [Nitrososphaera sp.]